MTEETLNERITALYGDWRIRLGNIEAHCKTYKWDSYGAAPVTAQAIETARKMCTSLDVVPTVNGGIQVGMLSEAMTIELDAAGKVTNVYFAGLFEWDDQGGFTPETGGTSSRD